jgi:hypothetical protein
MQGYYQTQRLEARTPSNAKARGKDTIIMVINDSYNLLSSLTQINAVYDVRGVFKGKTGCP